MDLARRLAAEGRLLEDCQGNNTHHLRLNFVPQMPAERLLEGYKGLLAEIYSPRAYFRRCRTLLSRLPKRPRVPAGAHGRRLPGPPIPAGFARKPDPAQAGRVVADT